MSYELFIAGKPRGQVASFGGMEKLTRLFGERDDALGRFLRDGMTRTPAALADAIRVVLDGEVDTDVRETLAGLLRRLPDHAIVSVSD